MHMHNPGVGIWAQSSRSECLQHTSWRSLRPIASLMFTVSQCGGSRRPNLRNTCSATPHLISTDPLRHFLLFALFSAGLPLQALPPRLLTTVLGLTGKQAKKCTACHQLHCRGSIRYHQHPLWPPRAVSKSSAALNPSMVHVNCLGILLCSW